MALHSALGQTLSGVEIVICDDSQDDQIKTIVSSLDDTVAQSLRYVRNPKTLGFADNVLNGMELARGQWVKVLCDDDRLLPTCLERQLAELEARPDISLVLAQRMYVDANNYVLPMRLGNARFASVDTRFKGSDMLALLEGRSLPFLGNLSAALMRRDEALPLLRTLTEVGPDLGALLDQLLFICLLRHGDLIMLSDVLVLERLHPGQFSKRPEVLVATAKAHDWMQQMLANRGSEPAPASGWVRQVSVAQSNEPSWQWKEVNLLVQLGNWQTCTLGRVGSDCESYDEVYQQWLRERHLRPAQSQQLAATLKEWPRQPRIVVLIQADAEGDEALTSTLLSLEAQVYPAYQCVIVGGGDAPTCLQVTRLSAQPDQPAQLNQLCQQLDGDDWIYLLRAGDRLHESALLVLAERIAVLPGIAAAYSDEGAYHDGHASEPVFKPDFNVDLMRSYPYVGRTLAFECGALLGLGGFKPGFGGLIAHDVLWRLLETRGPQSIEHIAEIQVQSSFDFARWLSSEDVTDHSARLVSAHLERLGVAHRLHRDGIASINRIEYLHDVQPLVSILVICGDDLYTLQQCVMSIIEHTAYPLYELLLMVEGSVDAAMQDWLRAMADVGGLTLRVLRSSADHALTARIDEALSQVQGEYLLTLAAHLQVTEPRWLEALLQQAQRPEVALVGPKVLDAAGKVVHAGMALGVNGLASPVYAGEDGAQRGYLQRLHVAQNWTVLSGDCLMIRASVWHELGGLDSQNFSWGLSELDLCLKARQAGYLTVWTPHACLRSQTPHAQLSANVASNEERQAFCQAWLPVIARDPAYNSNLSLMNANFSLDPGQRASWNPLCARIVPSILGLPINATAVGHYRVIQPFHELEAAGLAIGRIGYETPSMIQLARMDPDVIVLQLRHGEEHAPELERIRRYSHARRVFEIDDYVIQAPSKNAHARLAPADIEHRLRCSVSLCDRVVVTTDALGNVLSGMHHDVRVVPNMLAPHLWLGLRSLRQTTHKPRVGWGGGTSHGGDLEIIADVVRTLADEVDWVFFGMCPDELRPYIKEFHPVVGLLAYPRKLASLNLDLALAPLEFHIFNDCKSNLRLLEYGACGYPVVCSDTQAYRGNLPCTRVRSNSSADWLEAIRMHLADPEASYRMGDRLRDVVLRDFVLSGERLQQWTYGWLAD